MQRLEDFESYRKDYFEIDGDPESVQTCADTWPECEEAFAKVACEIERINLDGYKDLNGAQLRQRINEHAPKMVKYFIEGAEFAPKVLLEYKSLLENSKRVMEAFETAGRELHRHVNNTVDAYEQEEINLSISISTGNATAVALHESNLATLASNYEIYHGEWIRTRNNALDYKRETHTDQAIALGQKLAEADQHVGDSRVDATSTNQSSDINLDQVEGAAKALKEKAKTLLTIAEGLNSVFENDTTEGGLRFRDHVIAYRNLLQLNAARVWHEMEELSNRMAHVVTLYRNAEDTNSAHLQMEVDETLAKHLDYKGPSYGKDLGLAFFDDLMNRLDNEYGMVGKTVSAAVKAVDSPTLRMAGDVAIEVAKGEEFRNAYYESFAEREPEIKGELAGTLPLVGMPAGFLTKALSEEATPQL